ncbi:MAG: hypothetical protein AAGD13_00605 [Pseudomonadota bacterium]
MTFSAGSALQIAVVDHLTTALAAAGTDGGAISVFDHVPDDPSGAHVRLEGQAFVAGPYKDSTPGNHNFSLRYFDGDGSAGAPVRGQMDVRRVLDLMIAALDQWRPIPGGAVVTLRGAEILPGDTASGFEGRARFTYPTS